MYISSSGCIVHLYHRCLHLPRTNKELSPLSNLCIQNLSHSDHLLCQFFYTVSSDHLKQKAGFVPITPHCPSAPKTESSRSHWRHYFLPQCPIQLIYIFTPVSIAGMQNDDHLTQLP